MSKKVLDKTPEKLFKQSKEKRRNISYLLYGISIFVFSMLFVGVTHIASTSEFRGEDLNAYKDLRYSVEEYSLASRGTIYDRYMNPVASDVEEYTIFFYLDEDRRDYYDNPDYVEDAETTTQAIVDVLDLDDEAYDYIYEKLSDNSGDKYLTYIGEYGEGISSQQKSEIDALNLQGVDYETKLARYYPYGDFASYLIGYTTSDDENNVDGYIGTEGQVNGYLKSNNGYTSKNVDKVGVSVDDNVIVDQPANGLDVVTTIDPQIQSIMQTEMDESLDGLEYAQAFSLMMDTTSGEILAAYSLPSFDPNVKDITNYVDTFSDYCYEPGSTVKTFTVATAMEEGVWDPSNVNDTGTRTDPDWGGETISDYILNMYGFSWGPIRWDTGYYFSSNTIMTHVFDAIGQDTFASYMTDVYQFGSAIDNPYLTTAQCSYEPKYPLEFANTIFGQGMTANPLQMARAYSVFGNDEGNMYTPHYVKQLINPETGEVLYDSTTDDSLVSENVISEQTVQDMQDLMYGGVYYDEEKGSGLYKATGYKYGYGDIEIIGKSGTSQIYGEDGYDLSNVIDSFAGFAPHDDPEIFLYTAVIQPSDALDASTRMGEYYAAIVDDTIGYLNADDSMEEKQEENAIESIYIEDYSGKEINEVTTTLEDSGLNVVSFGDTTITAQYPAPNQYVSSTQNVYIRSNDEINMNEMIGKSSDYVYSVCELYDLTCNFDGIGEVSSFEMINDNSYDIYTGDVENVIEQQSSSMYKRKELYDLDISSEEN